MDRRASSTAGRYQKLMPITDKNIGKNYLKMGNTLHTPNSTKERLRRQKQLAKQEAKQAKRAKHLEGKEHESRT